VVYMLAGYAVMVGLPLLYIVSAIIRRRNLERDLEMIERLAQDEKKRQERKRAGARQAAAGETAEPALKK
jgi:hypothetical protein